MSAVLAESTGSVIEAVATQGAYVRSDSDLHGWVSRVSRYAVVFSDGHRESIAPQLFVSYADAAEHAAAYKSYRIVRVLVEVSDA